LVYLWLAGFHHLQDEISGMWSLKLGGSMVHRSMCQCHVDTWKAWKFLGIEI
jgi:hypothetical protein